MFALRQACLRCVFETNIRYLNQYLVFVERKWRFVLIITLALLPALLLITTLAVCTRKQPYASVHIKCFASALPSSHNRGSVARYLTKELWCPPVRSFHNLLFEVLQIKTSYLNKQMP